MGNSQSGSRQACWSSLFNHSLLPIPYSLFPTPYSLLPIPYSLFPIPYSLFPTPYSPFPSNEKKPGSPGFFSF